MKILIDTNVIIDFAPTRQSFANSVKFLLYFEKTNVIWRKSKQSCTCDCAWRFSENYMKNRPAHKHSVLNIPDTTVSLISLLILYLLWLLIPFCLKNHLSALPPIQYLLCTTAISIYAAALKCGYKDKKHFDRQFRQSVAALPVQWGQNTAELKIIKEFLQWAN